MTSGPNHRSPFPETRWSLVNRAAVAGDETGWRALGELCALYWVPVYAFVRSQGHSPHDAEDLTQGFFALFLERNDFSKADPSRGRLRSYLLTAVKNHLLTARRDGGRQKRGGAAVHFSLDRTVAEENWASLVAAEGLTPDRLYDRQWATTLLEQVVVALASDYQERGQDRLFEALRAFLTRTPEPGEMAAAAAALSMSEGAVRVAIHRLRQRYAAGLRLAVADTLAEGEDLEVELAYLKAVFS